MRKEMYQVLFYFTVHETSTKNPLQFVLFELKSLSFFTFYLGFSFFYIFHCLCVCVFFFGFFDYFYSFASRNRIVDDSFVKSGKDSHCRNIFRRVKRVAWSELFANAFASSVGWFHFYVVFSFFFVLLFKMLLIRDSNLFWFSIQPRI